ncbi:MAG: hypothetical protein KKA45_00270 [Alphaproteobacteria bacterium]|nr:hypothetical protein [Alphaproteobacteria bacterium]
MRRLAGMGLALALSGCASVGSNPEYAALLDIEAPSTAADLLTAELDAARSMGNAYRSAAASLTREDGYAGGLTLGASLYGAAVTGFNPAPKNLLGALFGAGAAQGWRVSLKPAERAKIYVHGYQAMRCLTTSGGVLLAHQETARLEGLRRDIAMLLNLAESARQQALASDGEADAANATTLDAQMDRLRALDQALRTEIGATQDAAYRVSKVRRQIESTVEARLAANAPDYAGALALIQASTKPPTPTPPEDGQERFAEGTSPYRATGARTLADLVAALAFDLQTLEAAIPTRAADAYARMGECVAIAG